MSLLRTPCIFPVLQRRHAYMFAEQADEVRWRAEMQPGGYFVQVIKRDTERCKSNGARYPMDKNRKPFSCRNPF